MGEKAERVTEAVIDSALKVWREGETAHWILVVGDSMAPLLLDGDRLRVSHVIGHVRRGDVLVFRRQGVLVAHRVLRSRREGARVVFLTKGDGVPSPDRPPVEEEQLVGRVVGLDRDGRYVALDRPKWRWLGWIIASGALWRLRSGKSSPDFGRTMEPVFKWMRALIVALGVRWEEA